MVEKGKWDQMIAVVGLPDSGKTDYATRRALALAQTSTAYLFGVDPGWRIPEVLYDGTSTNLRRHSTLATMAEALKTKPQGCHCADALPKNIIEYARRVGQASIGQGDYAAPVLVLIDEATSVKGMRSWRMDDETIEAVTGRRHDHTGYIVSVQHPKLTHQLLLGLATEIVMFRLEDSEALKRLRESGVPPDVVDQVPRLVKYQYLTYRRWGDQAD